jgi:citrate synthase
MVRARDLLDRFRPAGAPGAASVVGVPADRLAEVTAELEPVFALLEDDERQCAQLREEAEHEAQRRREQVAERVEHLGASARETARAVRAEEAGSARRRGEEASRAAVEAAVAEAAALRERAQQRLPEWVALAVRAVQEPDHDAAPREAAP